jgi:hypothetical protein
MTAGLDPGRYNSSHLASCQEYSTRASRKCQREEGGRTCIKVSDGIMRVVPLQCRHFGSGILA